jgi:hypothetical protein
MLSSHPRIVVTRRTDLWPRFFERYGDLSGDGNLDRCVRAMLARAQIATLEIDAERLVHDFRAGAPTYARLFALIHEQVADRRGRPRWGDQSASIEAYADDVLAAYPGARFIHLIRDPRDRFTAELQREPRRRPGDAGRSVAAWLWSARLAERNRERYPDAYRPLRYETLVADPERTMREVCDFLGERFDAAMLRIDEAARYRQVREASPDGSPITTEFVGRYRRDLPPGDVAFIQRAAGREMDAHGYGADPTPMSARQRLRVAAVGRPVNGAAMWAWRGTRSPTVRRAPTAEPAEVRP